MRSASDCAFRSSVAVEQPGQASERRVAELAAVAKLLLVEGLVVVGRRRARMA